MLFNSFEFLFVFLPLVLVAVFGFRRIGAFRTAEATIILASLAFFAWWNWRFLGLLLFSALFNWSCANAISRAPTPKWRRIWLSLGVGVDLAILGFFKYGLFVFDAVTLHLSQRSSVYVWILPLGISFWTFEQIIYLVDCYRRDQHPLPLKDYLLFVTFFPRLIAGPIVRPRDFFRSYSNWRESIGPAMFAAGISLISIGLFKKVCLADRIAPIVTAIFSLADTGSLVSPGDALVAATGFALQIYFDFSGYSDIAVGSALLLGIRLPANFASPYKSTSIIEFWRRWHISLSTFLRDYLYVPLGGNRNGALREAVNIAVTMALGGLWHGAGVNFILWGVLHGAYVNMAHVARRSRLAMRLPRWIAGVATTYAVCVAWVFFRADTFGGAARIISALFPVKAIATVFRQGNFGSWPASIAPLDFFQTSILVYGAIHCLLLPSSVSLFRSYILAVSPAPVYAKGPEWRPHPAWAILFAVIFAASIWMMLGGRREFIYFQF
jgi:alginate O-acetyltransferase complex protein AlgI